MARICIECKNEIKNGERYAVGLSDFIHMACLDMREKSGRFMIIANSNLIMGLNK